MQREIKEMKEQENSSLWQGSPHQNSGQNKRTPKENFFWVMEFRNSWIQIHHSQSGCKEYQAAKIQAIHSPEVQWLRKLQTVPFEV
jgi:hypothetical protein